LSQLVGSGGSTSAKPGRIQAATKPLCRELPKLQYEIFFNEDQSEALVFERYRDADAAIEHFSNISHLMEPIMATA